MENIILVMISALISGLLATLVTIFWQKRTAVYQEKLSVFKTLMSLRYDFSTEESVKALNAIDVLFYKDKGVRDAFKSFLDEADKNPELHPNIADKHLKLLEEISKSLKLTDIHWDEIKRYYYPRGLAERIQDENVLRKVQIQSSVDLIEQNKKQQNAPNDQLAQQMVLQILPSLLQNPDSLKTLMELGEKYGDKNDTTDKKSN